MKKMFFLKSSSSNGRDHHEKSGATIDKKGKQQKLRALGSQNVEKKLQNVTETKSVSKNSGFRRSRSLSMISGVKNRGGFCAEDLTELRNLQRFSSSNSLCNCSDCNFQLKDRDSKPERYNVPNAKRLPVEVTCNRASSSSSVRNSFDSTSISNQMLDLYMDGDRLPTARNGLHSRFFVEKTDLFIPSHNTSTEHQNESPRKLAKNVVDRLLRLEKFRDLNPSDTRSNYSLVPTNVSDKHLDRQIYEDTTLLEREYVSIFPGKKSDAISSEEHRLKDRLRELEDHNFCLEREISAFCSKEKDYIDRLSQTETNVKDLNAKLDEVNDKLAVAEDAKLCLEKNFRETEKENTELIKATSRVQMRCSEQERTINGLRQCLNSEIDKRENSGKVQSVTHKIQMEQSRLTEVEQVLRKQLESVTAEIQSLRTENMYLLERLKDAGQVSSRTGHSGLKLDQELVSCVQSLKKTGLSLLNESVQTCEQLLKIIGKAEFRQGYEYDIKVSGLKQGLEQLTRSLGKVSFVLVEKGEIDNHESDIPVVMEDDLRSELKAECLLTSLLKEKLYCKEKEVEKVQAELARALRCHDVLKSEIQDAFDTVSCLNHRMKSFELQMIEKDGTINQLQGEVRTQETELGTTKNTLSKVTQERDLMWEEVKQYSEKNMLLNRELSYSKKKIDALEEDTLLKDGQISILKDSLSNANFFGVERGELFKL